MMRAVLRLVSRGGPVWLGILTAVAFVAVAAARGRDSDIWLVWPRASAVTDTGVLLAGPIAAGMACWITQARRAARPGGLLAAAPRPAVQGRACDLLTLLAPAAVGTLLGHGIGWSRALLAGASGTPLPAYAGLTVTTVLIATTAGYAAGRLAANRLLPAVLGFGVAVTLLVWPSDQSMDVWFVNNGWPQLEVDPVVLALRAAIASGLAVAAVVATRQRLILATVAAGAGVLAVLVTVTAGQPLQTRHPLGQACTSGAPTLCLWRDNATHLAAAERAVELVAEAVAGTLAVPATPLLEEGLALGDESIRADGAAVTVRMGEGELAASLAIAWFDAAPVCGADVDPARADLDAWLLWHSWVGRRLAATSLGDDPLGFSEGLDRERLDAALLLDDSAQIAWASALVPSAQGCPPG